MATSISEEISDLEPKEVLDLDGLLGRNDSYIPLTVDSAQEFIAKVNEVFPLDKLVDYSSRAIRLKPFVAPEPWRARGTIRITAATCDSQSICLRYDIYPFDDASSGDAEIVGLDRCLSSTHKSSEPLQASLRSSYASLQQRTDIFIDLRQGRSTAHYRFMPKDGLYLHEEAGGHATDHMLLFPQRF